MLTYMATLLSLVRSKTLSKYLPDLRPGEQEFRMLFAAPRFEKWILEDLPKLASSWNLDLTPVMQVDEYLINYAIGAPLTFDWHFKPVRHIKDGVWELKTADTRMFGWFHRIDVFIALIGDDASRVKKHKLYTGYAGEVVQYRDKLDLDEPKYVPGKDPRNVISNFIAAP